MAIKTYKLDFRPGDKLFVGTAVYEAGDTVELDESNPIIDGRFVLTSDEVESPAGETGETEETETDETPSPPFGTQRYNSPS